MMCCGRTRPITAARRIDPPVHSGVEFTYVGRTSLTITGPASGVVYRFPASGARLTVQHRDVAALRRVAVLRAAY